MDTPLYALYNLLYMLTYFGIPMLVLDLRTRGLILGRRFVPVPSSFAVKSFGLGVRELKIHSLSFGVRELKKL